MPAKPTLCALIPGVFPGATDDELDETYELLVYPFPPAADDRPDPYVSASPTWPPTHVGPDGPVRAHQWYGRITGGTSLFLSSGGPVAYWLEGLRFAVDPEHGPVRYAAPGDRLVWAGGQLTVVTRADFLTDYRPR